MTPERKAELQAEMKNSKELIRLGRADFALQVLEAIKAGADVEALARAEMVGVEVRSCPATAMEPWIEGERKTLNSNCANGRHVPGQVSIRCGDGVTRQTCAECGRVIS